MGKDAKHEPNPPQKTRREAKKNVRDQVRSAKQEAKRRNTESNNRMISNSDETVYKVGRGGKWKPKKL